MKLPPCSYPTTSSYGRGTIRISRHHGSIVVVALNRPRVKNAFSDDLFLDLIEIMHTVAADDSCDAIVLTGTGSYFSSGADLEGTNFDTTIERDTLNSPAGKFMMAIIEFPKIIAAAINGPAVGIGVTLLLHCDLCYCSSETATLWAPFTRLALAPELGSSATFIETMGLSKANEMLLLGKKIDAQTAVQWNICSRLIPGTNTQDPFHSNSLATHMANEIYERLLSLPFGNETVQVFVKLIRSQRRQARMQRVCREEIVEFDERFNSGKVLKAAMQLNLIKKNRHSRL